MFLLCLTIDLESKTPEASGVVRTYFFMQSQKEMAVIPKRSNKAITEIKVRSAAGGGAL